MDQITHIYTHNIPIYQWSAIDVNSRFKLIAYSMEKSWTNGLTWFLWVTSWIRSHEITNNIVYTVDHGVEFGGDCWWKITELRHLLKGFGVSVIQNQKNIQSKTLIWNDPTEPMMRNSIFPGFCQ